MVAVTCGGVSLSYGGLEERANRLAHYLRGVGVGGESVVGLCLERGAGMVVAMLAVWKAGGAYLPLDPAYPAGRLAFMLADSHASVLAGTAAIVAELPAGRIRVITLDDPLTVAAVAAAPPGPPPVPAVVAGQLAYVMYTSGSTGAPKGVQVTHGGVVNLTVAQGPVFGVTGGVNVLAFASFSFDAAVSEVCVTLAAGASLVIAAAGERAEPGALAGLVRDRGVAVATLPPSLLGVLAPGELAGLVTLVSAGERLDGGVADRWREHHRLLNAYGPTEATVCASIAVTGPGGPPLIGGPVANTRLQVLDRHLGPVPVGVAGDLHIGGAGVARGYAGRPGLTAERFIADPLAGDGSRLYRTGDRARWRPSGQLEFLGRADDQVKIRGYRIEPGEIETALTTHPAITAAVVTADGGGTAARLVAWLVPADPAAGIPPAAGLRAHLGQQLPGFMIPAVFTELAALPLTTNGKLDRAALPAPDAGRPELAGRYMVPVTPAEELLAGIWAQVLGLDRVGADDNFFDLGGHSLLATQVISQIRGVFGAETPLAFLFDHPTVRDLAAVIENSAPRVVVPPVTTVRRDQRLPLSFAQQRLWFLDQLEPGSAAYNAPSPVRLGGDLDVAALGAALGAVVRRHEVLRTRLVAGPDGVPHQVIDPPAPFPLPIADVSVQADPVAAARGLVAADAAAPFDLAAGPLIRAVLIRLAAGEHVLALSMHHVVSDEWSAGIFRRELGVLYAAFGRGEPDPLPPLVVQYADFAVWQRRWLAGDVLDGQLAYWRGRLAGAPVLELPADRPRPLARSAAGAVVQFTVAAEVAAGLRAVARGGGATMFMTLLAALGVLLGRYSGQDDVVAGTAVANRNHAGTEDLIGFFVNTLVMRADLSGDPEFTGLLGRVREMALGAYAHQDLPFEQLVDALVTGRDRSRTPLFQVFFGYVGGDGAGGAPGNDGELGGDTGSLRPAGDALAETGAVKFDLSVMLGDAGGGGLVGGIQYRTALFDAGTVGRMAGHLVTVLEAVAADAGRPLSQLPVLSVGERDQLVREWNDTAAAVPEAGGLHELITARAAVCTGCGGGGVRWDVADVWGAGGPG